MKEEQKPVIDKIIHMEPFRVACLWSDGKVRVNAYNERIESFKSTDLTKWADFEEFKKVGIDENGGLKWPSINLYGATYRMSSEELYETSLPFSAYRLVPAEDAA